MMTEHEKLAKVKYQSQAIGQFLEWLQEELGALIAVYAPDTDDDGEQVLTPLAATIEELLAEYFEVNLEKLEAEKRAMLAEIRARYEVSDGLP